MKIKSIEKLNDGMDREAAEYFWGQVESFAAYSFNLSHSVEYSIISVWTMWLRVRYPAEYFAACMSIVKEDKLPGLVTDARECGIEVMPPDINLSTDKFTIPDDKHILAPFSSVKGVSENTALRIVELRNAAGGKFPDVAAFQAAASAKGSKVNARVVENLGKVGAYANLDKTEKPPRHLDRRKDQTELMPGLIIDSIKSDRVTDVSDKFLRSKIIMLVQDYKKCEGCSLAGQPHPNIRLKSTVKFMVVTDCPTWQEEKKDKLMEGDASDYIKLAIKEAGLAPGDGYYTTLVKAKKSDKFLTNEQINGCTKFIERELELVKPPVIVALGSAAIKFFVPGVKNPSEMAGKVVYDSARDAQIVCGVNPSAVVFDPSKAEILGTAFEKVAEIVS